MWFPLWLLFVVLIVLLPLWYGWGYRGWGPPVPRRRSQAERARAEAGVSEPGWDAWMVGVVWVASLIASIWIIIVLAG